MTKHVTITRPDGQFVVFVPDELVPLLVAICQMNGWQIQAEDAD